MTNPMVPLSRHKGARLLVFALLTGLAVLQLRLALTAQHEYSSHPVHDPLTAYRGNPRMLTWHAKQAHLFNGDLGAAETLYRQALIANPVFIPAWLGLAELRNDTGNNPAAHAILELVSGYTDNVKRWSWDKVLVAYQFRRLDLLATDLAYIIAEVPGKTQADALRMAGTVWPDPIERADTLGPAVVGHLFRHAVRTRALDDAIALWPRFETLENDQRQGDVLRFLNLLIAEDQIRLAAEIWRHTIGGTPLLHNGDFATPPLQAAFGWRIRRHAAFVWQLAPPNMNHSFPALHLRFNGQENIAFHHVWQLVPLRGGQDYLLQGQWQSTALTTNERPLFEVTGHKCQAPRTRTDMIAADQAWQPFTLRFHVPHDCEAMVVRLRRTPSHHIDNRLGGELRLADLRLTAVDTSGQP
ncbi:tetratricopeptide repeat protein [Desulfobulbus alkaliphilus]|uniref:tetratricopeptide repeat protein n=1 Tax=Desulfobulbus alkaliphilus TaxID=869814 RepID=UPI001963D4ED|nr:tetratricopeptide repeat protein [Desulfobulbus alkaliphilus]MBM9537385.1 hypothetical protein [Desulfobulbus alkaliphilus]